MNELTFETVQHPGGATVLAVVGSADLSAANELDRALARVCAARPPHVVLDLSRLKYLSSICIGVILRHQNVCREWDGKVTLAAPNEMVAGALRSAALDKVVPIAPSVAAALASA